MALAAIVFARSRRPRRPVARLIKGSRASVPSSTAWDFVNFGCAPG